MGQKDRQLVLTGIDYEKIDTLFKSHSDENVGSKGLCVPKKFVYFFASALYSIQLFNQMDNALKKYFGKQSLANEATSVPIAEVKAAFSAQWDDEETS